MKKVAIVLTFCFFSLNTFSQVNVRGLNQTATRTSEVLQILRKPVIYDSLNVKGSPYEYNVFFYGYLYENDKPIGSLPMRYNIYNDEFQVRLEEDDINGLTFDENYKIEIYNSTYIPLIYDFKNKKNLKGYFLALNKGDYKLLEKKRKIYIPAKPPKNSLSPGFPARFIDSKKLYFLSPSLKKPELIKGKNEFISLFEKGLQDKVSEFIKENDISLKSEEDLMALFDFLNTEL